MPYKEIDIDETSPRVANKILVFKIWVTLLTSALILGIVTYALTYVHPDQWQALANGIILGLEITLTGAVVAGAVSLYKFLTAAQIIHIGEQGTVVKGLRGNHVYAPMGIAQVRIAQRKAGGKTVVTSLVPLMSELIGTDVMLGQIDMLFGFESADNRMEAVRGPWPGTAIIAGKGGSGKTRRAMVMIFQAILAQASIIICDPHAEKPDSLTNGLAAFREWLTFVSSPEDITAACREHNLECKRRLRGKSSENMRPRLVVIDEIPAIMKDEELADEDKKEITTAIRESASQYRGVFGYAWIMAQEFTADALYDPAIRKVAQATFCHQLSSEYAKYLFPQDSKTQKTIQTLTRRECVYKDNDNQLKRVQTPGCPDSDLPILASYLYEVVPPQRIVPNTVTPKQLAPFRKTVSSFPELPKTPVYEAMETETVSVTGPLEPIEAVSFDETSVRDTDPIETIETSSLVRVSPSEEQQILSAAYTLLRETGKEPSRNAIMGYLNSHVGTHWNKRAKWGVLSTVLNAHNIAMKGDN